MSALNFALALAALESDSDAEDLMLLALVEHLNRSKSNLSRKTRRAKQRQAQRAGLSREQRDAARHSTAARARLKLRAETPQRRELRLKLTRIEAKRRRVLKLQLAKRKRRERVFRRIAEGGSTDEESTGEGDSKCAPRKRKCKKKPRLNETKNSNGNESVSTDNDAEHSGDELLSGDVETGTEDSAAADPLASEPQDAEMVTVQADPTSPGEQVRDENNSTNDNVQ